MLGFMCKVGNRLSGDSDAKWKEHQSRMQETWVLVLTLPPPGCEIFSKSFLLSGSQFMYLEVEGGLNKLSKGRFGENTILPVSFSATVDTPNESWRHFP